MPESVAEIITRIQARIRDPQGAIHDADFVLGLLSRCQQLINNFLSLVLITETMGTVAYQNFYHMPGYLPQSITILSVKEHERDLHKLESLRDLRDIDQSWHRRIGPRHECFIQLGDSYLILWPAKATDSTIDVVSTKLTAPLASVPLDQLEISTEKTPILVDLMEILLLMRQRDLQAAAAKSHVLAIATGLELPRRNT